MIFNTYKFYILSAYAATLGVFIFLLGFTKVQLYYVYKKQKKLFMK